MDGLATVEELARLPESYWCHRPPADAPKKKSPVLLIAIAVLVLVLGGGGAFAEWCAPGDR